MKTVQAAPEHVFPDETIARMDPLHRKIEIESHRIKTTGFTKAAFNPCTLTVIKPNKSANKPDITNTSAAILTR